MADTVPTELFGSSEKMREVLSAIDKVAASQSTVLIRGETGTGKSTIARAIHAASTRAAQPFVVFDCAAVAPNLIESELFGHERGAFTGATQRRIGALESAKGGTLFIDELSELPLALQPKLLRALEDRVFAPLGSESPVAMSCRIIAATQVDLARLVEQKQFRGDLYYRLTVIELPLPPLRERREDLPLLVDAFFRANGSAQTFAGLDAEQKRSILRDPWPGNVRQLRNHIERMSLSMAPVALPAPTPEAGSKIQLTVELEGTFNEAKAACVNDFEAAYLRRLLAKAGDNITRAAQIGRINRRHLYDLLRKHGLHA